MTNNYLYLKGLIVKGIVGYNYLIIGGYYLIITFRNEEQKGEINESYKLETI